MTSVQKEEGSLDTDTHAQGRSRDWGGETARQDKPEVTGCRWTPGGGKEGISLELSEGAWPCLHLDFSLVASRTVGQCMSVVLCHPVCGAVLSQP